MNKKGFTLTEIIGAIIILGILVIIAVVTFTGSMKGFREDYYTESVRTLTEAGKEFFNDNRKYRPHDILGAQTVPIGTLVTQHYLDDVKDYKGNSCSSSSYIIVIKNGKDDYAYHACLVCPEDDFSNMEDKYCDASWTNSTTIEYNITRPPELYVYKGTPKSELRDKLAIKASYVKKNAKGEILGIVDGTGFDEAPTIYPDDIDAVDLNKLGKYPLTYTYMEKQVKGFVVVYEYNEPTVNIKKENVVASTLAGATITETGNYSSGEWAQKIYVTITAGEVDAGGVDLSTTSLSNIVHKYQWNKDGVWQDFCGGDDCTNVIVTTEMNENISFRSRDVNDVFSEETAAREIKIDNTKPTCSIVSSGPHKDNEWYTGDVTITFTKNEDLIGASPESFSGVAVSNITKEGDPLSRVELLTNYHRDDTKGIKYIGFVEDRAKNFYLCDTSFKRDATDPVCTITGHATLNCSDPTSGLVKVSYTQTNNYTEATPFSPVETWSDTRTITTKGRWYLRAFDYAGNSGQVSSMYCLITYDKNGGDTEPAKASEVKRETELADLSQVTRKAQYKMIGWHTSATSTTALSSYTVQEETDRTLYAVYVKCGKGYYTNESGNDCNLCPEGYRDGEPAGNISGCEKKVLCGSYVKVAQAQEIKCSAGYYSSEHTVKYGDTSSCTEASNGYYAPVGACNQTQCPANYRDGTTHANKVSESSCLNNVVCGKHVATANNDEVNCDAGYYSSAHSVTYGNTSSCTEASNGYYATAGSCNQTQCPANYRDGTAVSNKTSESACLRTVSCGKYVNSSRGISNCAAGHYSQAHSVTYGGTDSCSKCSAGTYQGSTGQCSCNSCKQGCTSAEGATAESQCYHNYSPGHGQSYANACIETICRAGTYRSGWQIQYYGHTLACDECPAGSYATGNGNTSCTQCSAGTYASGTANGSCSSCTGNTYSGAGASSCTSCPSGQTANSTHTGCETPSSSGDDNGSGGGGGGSCFLPGTLVVTKDGYKAIEKIKQGDYVLSYNETTKQNEYKEVVKPLVHKDKTEDLYTLTVEDYELKVTEAHRFYVLRKNMIGILGIKEYVAAKDLVVGDKVVYSNGSNHEITNISYVTETNTVYNIEVKDNHNYYVSEKEILVHNMKDQELPY